MVGDRHVDALAIERRAPFDPALISAGTDERAPDRGAGDRVEQRVDAALGADADDVTIDFQKAPGSSQDSSKPPAAASGLAWHAVTLPVAL